ncbi:hypothetical protein A2U01_0057701 [Trifolium medium]|uniref:Uncharacterized protein n=1 Tax=Trifolium medium TaxID=97028 RepID=A0A392RIQ9_9FABA|nr:hypothetical protein [Trifolium medium]
MSAVWRQFGVSVGVLMASGDVVGFSVGAAVGFPMLCFNAILGVILFSPVLIVLTCSGVFFE